MMDTRVDWLGRFVALVNSFRRLRRVLAKGNHTQKLLAYLGIGGVVITILFVLTEVWKLLPGIVGIGLLYMACREEPREE